MMKFAPYKDLCLELFQEHMKCITSRNDVSCADVKETILKWCMHPLKRST
jgi:hypothetical protein